jgi:hypothetical protein
MAFIRERGGSHQLIETYREGDKVRQRILANLGPAATVAEAIASLERQSNLTERQQRDLEALRRYAGTGDKPTRPNGKAEQEDQSARDAELQALRAEVQVLRAENAKLKAKPSDPTIDPATLSLTAQQKLDLAIRQATKKLEVELLARARAEVRQIWNEKYLPRYNEKMQHYERVLQARRGVMTREIFKKIWKCLHPDWVPDADRKPMYAEAFRLFSHLEVVLLNEKEFPTKGPELPKTWADLMALKEKGEAERKAKRAAAKAVKVR